jgi:hypothetical protein
MRRCMVVCCALVLAAASSVRADWVILTDGHRVRGIDLKKQKNGYLFTVETGKTAFIKTKDFGSYEKSSPGEMVPFRGKDVTLREMIVTLKREHQERQKQMQRAVERWALAGAKAEEARGEVMSLPTQEQEVCFGRVLVESSSAAARRLAATELRRFSTKHALKSLAMSAVIDRSEGVRAACMQSLQALKMPKTGDEFVPFLMSRDKNVRLRASLALRAFPTYRAIPALMVTIHKIWSGGGRSYFFQGEQRAYIGDYELVSGGTGYVLTEVADPIVRFSEAGVVLDAKIASSEETIHLTTLEAIAGQNFGTNIEAWREWWKTKGEAQALLEAAAKDARAEGDKPAAAEKPSDGAEKPKADEPPASAPP